MFHPTYKRIEDGIRLAGLTLPQWAGLFAAAIVAYLLSGRLPLPGTWGLSVAITVVGVPVAAVLVLAQAEFSAWTLLAAVWRFRRGARRYRPGVDSADPRPGYRV